MITTVTLNHIRNPEELSTLKKVLTDFLTLNRTEAVAVYEHEYGWGEEDLDADTEMVMGLLEKIEHRLKSLSTYLAKVDKNALQTPPDGCFEPTAAEPQP